MKFGGDIHQTRVKIAHFRLQKFSVDFRSIFFFVVFERAPQDAVPVRLTGTAVFNALSNKKKISEIMSYGGRVLLEMRPRTHLLRKTRNKFFKYRFFKKTL